MTSSVKVKDSLLTRLASSKKSAIAKASKTPLVVSKSTTVAP
jgi:hypothetical protein